MNLTDAQRRVLTDYAHADDPKHATSATYPEWIAAAPELEALGLLAPSEGTVTHAITDEGRAVLDSMAMSRNEGSL
jgi:hypothetical protein